MLNFRVFHFLIFRSAKLQKKVDLYNRDKSTQKRKCRKRKYASHIFICKCASPYKKIRSLQIESGFLIWFHRSTSRAYYADARAERPYYSELRISFTLSEMARPSALPASCLLATPITLPMSFGDVAPT